MSSSLVWSVVLHSTIFNSRDIFYICFLQDEFSPYFFSLTKSLGKYQRQGRRFYDNVVAFNERLSVINGFSFKISYREKIGYHVSVVVEIFIGSLKLL